MEADGKNIPASEPVSVYLVLAFDYTPLSVSTRPYSHDGMTEFIDQNIEAVKGMAKIPDRVLVKIDYDRADCLPDVGNDPYKFAKQVFDKRTQLPHKGLMLPFAVYCKECGLDPTMNEWDKEPILRSNRMYAFSDRQNLRDRTNKGVSLYLSVRPDLTITNYGGGYGIKDFVSYLNRTFETDETYTNCRDNVYMHVDITDWNKIPDMDRIGNDNLHVLLTSMPAHERQIVNILNFDDVLGDKALNHSPFFFEPGRYAHLFDRTQYQRRDQSIEADKEVTPFPLYAAIDSPEGVMLFSKTEEGKARMHNYLQNCVDNIFTSFKNDGSAPALMFNDAIITDAGHLKKVDTFPATGKALPSEEYCADQSALHYAAESKWYHTEPKGMFIERLVNPWQGENLEISPKVYDKICLDYIIDNGLPQEGFEDYPHEFSYQKVFEPYMDRLHQTNLPQQRHAAQMEAKLTAVGLNRQLTESLKADGKEPDKTQSQTKRR